MVTSELMSPGPGNPTAWKSREQDLDDRATMQPFRAFTDRSRGEPRNMQLGIISPIPNTEKSPLLDYKDNEARYSILCHRMFKLYRADNLKVVISLKGGKPKRHVSVFIQERSKV